MSTPIFNLGIVGGGIMGLATAVELLTRFPGLRVVVLEKESQVATHQTGRNSGVIHSGIYYRPGSKKAKTCVTGARLMVEFCRAHHIPVDVCGKVVVATEDSEIPALEMLYRQGIANGVPGLSLIGPERLQEVEPRARGMRALHVPHAAVVDFSAVARVLADLIRQRGGEIWTSARVTSLQRRGGAWVIDTTAGAVQSTGLVTCGGLYSDRLTRMSGAIPELRIVPFRGEYYELVPERRGLVRGMIYPVPDMTMPFLGVHFTRTISGHVEVGPNAILALKREGYRARDVNLRDSLEIVGFPGFWRMSRKHWWAGLGECYRAWSKQACVRQLARLVPDVRTEDLQPGKTGVRAQAVDRQGALVNDFRIVQGPRAIHVQNVPSPAATASLAIACAIADMATTTFSLATSRSSVINAA